MQDKPLLSHLTGFRAIAAYAVLFGHFIDARINYHGIQLHHEFAAVFAYFGMTFFFTLSGFVITYTYYDIFLRGPWHRALWRFFAARFARLYPLYVLAMLLQFKWLVPAMYHASWGERLTFATLTQSWFNFQHIVFANAWSISSEVFFYIVFAVFMGMLSVRRVAHAANFERLRIATVLFTAGTAAVFYALFFYRDPIGEALTPYFSHRTQESAWGWLSYFSPFTRIADFTIGAMAARLFMLKREVTDAEARRSRLLSRVALLLVLLLGIYHSACYQYDTFLFFISQNFGAAPMFAYLFYASSTYGGRLKRLGSHRLMIAAGTISYSLYMLQFVIFFWPFFTLFPRIDTYPPGLWDWVIAYIGVIFYIGMVTVVSIISYRYIEAPARRFIRRKSHAEPSHA